MAEVGSAEGVWDFDGERLRIIPGDDRRVHRLRRTLGELTVPAEAIAEVTYTPDRRAGGTLRARLRVGADPLTEVAAGQLPVAADPYRLAVDVGAAVAADFLIDAVRFSAPERGAGPVPRFLVSAPRLPVQVTVSEATVAFDGQKIHIDWGWQAPEAKRRAGAQDLRIDDVTGVVWRPSRGLHDGVLRFDLDGAAPPTAGAETNAVRLTWGTDKELLTVLVAAAVVATLARSRTDTLPSMAELSMAEPPAGDRGADLDPLLARLRQFAELNRDGVLTDEEFALAKQSILRRMIDDPG